MTRLQAINVASIAIPLACLAVLCLQSWRAASPQEARLAELQTQNELLQDRLVRQRELLREQTLENTRRSPEEFFALLPSKFPTGDWQPSESDFEDCWFTSSDGLRLHGWYLKHENARAVLLHVHGNAGNLSHRAGIAERLHTRLHASVLLFDYRGYGRSEGIPTIEGILRDARAARAELAARDRMEADQIVLLGESLGGAVAVEMAAEDGARGLILENTFSSLRDVAGAYYPKLLVSMVVSDRLDSAANVARYRGPMLQVHGDADTIVPVESGRKLFSAANEPKTLLILPGHDHNDPLPERYYEAVQKFVADMDK